MTAAHVSATADMRRHVAALDRIHHGQPVAYFDGPGGTQVPVVVVEAMCEYLRASSLVAASYSGKSTSV